jgi:hypothetical protein
MFCEVHGEEIFMQEAWLFQEEYANEGMVHQPKAVSAPPILKVLSTTRTSSIVALKAKGI